MARRLDAEGPGSAAPGPCRVGNGASARSACVMGEDREEEDRHDVDDLDHRVDGGTGGVLVGIADGIAGDGGLMGVRALAAVMAVLNVFLGIVPGPTARG